MIYIIVNLTPSPPVERVIIVHLAGYGFRLGKFCEISHLRGKNLELPALGLKALRHCPEACLNLKNHAK